MTTLSQTKRILVPLDLNETGEDLLYYAGQMAHALGAELYLFHACKTADMTFTQQSSCIQKLRSFAERVFSREFNASKVAAPFDCVVRPGQIRDSIQSVVQDYQIDLVLMDAGARANKGLTDEAAEQTAAIMELVSCPVMVVPACVRYRKLKNLVFATDFTDQDQQVLFRIADLAQQLKAKLTLVQVYGEEERSQLCSYKAAMLELEKQLEGRKVAFRLLEEEDVLEGISEFSEKASADLLILATQDNFLMERLFSTNYMKTMAFHTRIPLLTYRQQKKKPCSGCCVNCKSKQEQVQLQAIIQ
ncbi:universal stress protein [Pontibacter virosus]|uniref:Nucleotide-binding universal stress UspA family protein n=1 Tax=Pontibacter virosus TaxID=1765052 RepID=A0A2U1AQN1_9BACT|nr:universal stress protein [Pontibacter virosus]PVY38733.1 nucleotide-binding universal stress UspA family protein [Pontibacter virosus]